MKPAVPNPQKMTVQEKIEELEAQLAELKGSTKEIKKEARPKVAPPPLPIRVAEPPVFEPKLPASTVLKASLATMPVAAAQTPSPQLVPQSEKAAFVQPPAVPVIPAQPHSPKLPVGPREQAAPRQPPAVPAKAKSRKGSAPPPLERGLRYFLDEVRPGAVILPKPADLINDVPVGAVIAQKFKYTPLAKNGQVEFGWELAEVVVLDKEEKYPWEACFVERNGVRSKGLGFDFRELHYGEEGSRKGGQGEGSR
eukprot:jgi/Mesvir1/8003/Mv20972-RA.1